MLPTIFLGAHGVIAAINSDVQAIKPIAIESAAVSQYVFLNKPIVVLFKQEVLGHKIVLRMRIKAYVNDPRQEFKFVSDITEILTKELYIKQNIELNQDNPLV